MDLQIFLILLLSLLIGYSLGCFILKGIIQLIGFKVSTKRAFQLPIEGSRELLKSLGRKLLKSLGG